MSIDNIIPRRKSTFFSRTRLTGLRPIDSDSDLISKRMIVQGLHQTLIEVQPSDNPKPLGWQRPRGKTPGREWAHNKLVGGRGFFPGATSIKVGIRQLQREIISLRPRNYSVPSCRPSQKPG